MSKSENDASPDDNGASDTIIGAIVLAVIFAVIYFFFFSSNPSSRDECFEVFRNTGFNSSFRTSFDKLGSGEMYLRGSPDKTTGYWERFSAQVGGNTSTITCYGDLDGNLEYIETDTDMVGIMFILPNGERSIYRP